MRAGHLRCGVRAQEERGLADLFGADELFGRVFVRDKAGCGFLNRNVGFLGARFDLAFDQFGADPARADCIGCDAGFSCFKGGDLGQSDYAMFGGDIGRLLDRGDKTVGGCCIDDPAPVFLAHIGNGKAGGVENR